MISVHLISILLSGTLLASTSRAFPTSNALPSPSIFSKIANQHSLFAGVEQRSTVLIWNKQFSVFFRVEGRALPHFEEIKHSLVFPWGPHTMPALRKGGRRREGQCFPSWQQIEKLTSLQVWFPTHSLPLMPVQWQLFLKWPQEIATEKWKARNPIVIAPERKGVYCRQAVQKLTRKLAWRFRGTFNSFRT